MRALDIEVEVAKHFNPRINLIIPNIWWGLGFTHELDMLIVTPARCAYEVEIKVSKQDLLVDKQKKHCHEDRRIRELYFAVPEKLKDIALQEIPERAGLFIVNLNSDKWYKRFDIVKRPKLNKHADKITDVEMIKLYHLASMRIWTLKTKLAKVYGKEPK